MFDHFQKKFKESSLETLQFLINIFYQLLNRLIVRQLVIVDYVLIIIVICVLRITITVELSVFIVKRQI